MLYNNFHGLKCLFIFQNFTKSYSEVDANLFGHTSNQHDKAKSRLGKVFTNTEGILSKSPIRFPILQFDQDGGNLTNVQEKNPCNFEKFRKRPSKKQAQATTKYLINYPISSLSDSPSNQSFVKSFNKANNMGNFICADNDTNSTSNVNSNLIESSSSNVMTVPLEIEQTKSTVILSEFKLS